MRTVSNIVKPLVKKTSKWRTGRFLSFLAIRNVGRQFQQDCNVVSLTFKNKAEELAYLDHFIKRFGAGNSVCCIITFFYFVGLWLIQGLAIHFEILPHAKVLCAKLAIHVFFFCCCCLVFLLYVATRIQSMRRYTEWWMFLCFGGIYCLSWAYIVVETARYNADPSSANKFSYLDFRLWIHILTMIGPQWIIGVTFFFCPSRTRIAISSFLVYLVIGLLPSILLRFVHRMAPQREKAIAIQGLNIFVRSLIYVAGGLSVVVLAFSLWYTELQDRIGFWKIRRCQEQICILQKEKEKRNEKKKSVAVEDLLELLLYATTIIQDAEASTENILLTESVDLLKKVENLLIYSSNVYEISHAFDNESNTVTDEEDLEQAFFGLYSRSGSKRGSEPLTSRMPSNRSFLHVEEPLPLENSDLQHPVGSSWDLPMLSMAQKTRHLLSAVGFLLLKDHVVNLNISFKRLSNYVYLLEQLYLPNPYHNQAHGATVAHTMECLFKMLRVVDSPFYGPIERVAICIAALGHDVGHPGRTNQFFVNSFNLLALLWNDHSVLEHYHAAWIFKLFEHENCNIIESLDAESTLYFRKAVIAVISGTDMSQHFGMISKFKMRRQTDDFSFHFNQEDFWLVVQMCIKAADLSHTLMEWDQHLEWSLRITEEFYQQGEEEKILLLDISPLCDRSRHSEFARSQKGFLQFVVQPLYSQLEELDIHGQIQQHCGKHLRGNKSKWEGLSDTKEVVTIPDEIRATKTNSKETISLAVHLLFPSEYKSETLLGGCQRTPSQEALQWLERLEKINPEIDFWISIGDEGWRCIN